MKELQAANENKQQELETVRKVGMDSALGEGLFHCRSHSFLTYRLWVYQDQVHAILERCFGKLFSQEVYLNC